MSSAEVIERERRWALPAAVSALAAVALIVIGVLVNTSVVDYRNNRTLLDSAHSHSGEVVAIGILQGLGFVLLAAPLFYLFRAAQARSDRVRGELVLFSVLAPLLCERVTGSQTNQEGGSMIRRHLTYANVMSTIAVFLLMGGSAYALAKKSVGTKQLKNNAVSAKKIKNGAVTGPKIRAGAVTGSGLTVSTTQVTGTTLPTTGSVGGGTATCPAGKKAIAGGGLSDTTNNGAYIEDSRPVTSTTGSPTGSGSFTGWRVIWQNTTATSKTPTVYVVCLG